MCVILYNLSFSHEYDVVMYNVSFDHRMIRGFGYIQLKAASELVFVPLGNDRAGFFVKKE